MLVCSPVIRPWSRTSSTGWTPRARRRGLSSFGGEHLLGTYVNHHGREVEIVASPEEADAAISLIATMPFVGNGDPDGLFGVVSR